MPDFFMPKDEIYENVKSLAQGFLIDIDDNGIPVLIIKAESAVLTSIIQGCNLEVIIRNPQLMNRGITIYVYDSPQDPLWFSWQELGTEDKNFKGFDDIALKILNSDKIRIALFNYSNLPVFTTLLEIPISSNDFHQWVHKAYNVFDPPIKNEYDHYYPEKEANGYSISIKNHDHSSEPMLNITSTEEEIIWGENWAIDRSYYNFSEYLKDGRHGYNQEISFKSQLSIYFEANRELFYSVEKHQNQELIDFLIHYEKAILLIESKFVLSNKPTKLNQALTKAVNQLNEAENTIKNHIEKIKNKELRDLINHPLKIIRICLINDKHFISDTKNNNIINKFNKGELPFFVSVRALVQIMASLKIEDEKNFKYQFIQNLIFIYNDYLKSEDEILILDDFRIIKNS